MNEIKTKTTEALEWYVSAMKETYKERPLSAKEEKLLFASLAELKARKA